MKTRLASPGFTLIETMIVVAIIGILVAIALYIFRDHAIRAKMSEVMLAASDCRTVVSITYQVIPPPAVLGANAWGCEVNITNTPGNEPTQYVQSITTDANGAIFVRAHNIAGAVDGKELRWVPTRPGSSTPLTVADMPTAVGEFVCSPNPATPIASKYLPTVCRN